MAYDRMQVKRAVRLMTVQKYRDGGNRDVGQGQSNHGQAPPGQVKYA